jgi:hypothetical protein
MCCSPSNATEATVVTTQFTPNVIREARDSWVPENADKRALRMNWVVVAEDHGKRPLRMNWDVAGKDD